MTEPTVPPGRTSFNDAAELYERARPGFPRGLSDDLAALTEMGPASRVLEIGPGTGQLTLPLARLGCALVAVELGPALAAIARWKLADYPRAQVVVSSFEDWQLPAQLFDVVVNANAYGWLDPRIRMIKIAQALRPGGSLALVATHHVAGGDRAFFEACQACYLRWDPNTRPGFRLPSAEQVPSAFPDLESSPHFGEIQVRRYEWESVYTAQQYRELLLTYSDHRALDAPRREGLLRCLTDLIESEFNGRIAKRYLAELRVARRTSLASEEITDAENPRDAVDSSRPRGG
ncbi:MAG: class I SAM-dependent methyltransferase [Thermoplasmata archaeon]|nr:class I SAM-dependent methyltransferase [Thermoplasmata archaeon]